MNYGLPPQTHAMKIHPWTVRLVTATQALREAIAANNPPAIVGGIEDTSFWVGRIICDGIGSEAAALKHPKRFGTAVQAVADGQKAILEAKSALYPSEYGSLPALRRKKWIPLFVLFSIVAFASLR